VKNCCPVSSQVPSPPKLPNDRQKRVRNATLSGKVFFDRKGAAADLAPHKLPAYFVDFETINFAVPIWKGTGPYQQIPFQFSIHRLSTAGELEHVSFLDLSGEDPSEQFASDVIAACGKRGPVYVYNASFETARIRELAKRCPTLRPELLAINARVVDLLKIAEQRFYHPDQHGSWSLKKLLPAIAAADRVLEFSDTRIGHETPARWFRRSLGLDADQDIPEQSVCSANRRRSSIASAPATR
jgi:hypothetical protein